jgi:DNA-directed RNA polymerase specialized sigma24 family protein
MCDTAGEHRNAPEVCVHRNYVSLVDEFGQPFSARLHEALIRLVPRLQHRFPALKDEYVLTEVLEETARNIVAREESGGPLKELDTYAWVALKNTAARRLQRGGWAVVGATLTAEQSSPVLASLPSGIATADQMEAEIHAQQVNALMSPAERKLCEEKMAGLSTDEIALRHGISSVAVRARWHRLKRKVSSLVAGAPYRAGQVRG